MTSSSRNWSAAVAAASVLALAVLVRWHAGLNPAVFVDEWYYSKMSRLMDLKDAFVPSYLYLWFFRASNACGTGFLECVRFGNAALFAGAAPFIYLTARAFTSARMAALVALLSLLAPLHLYTSFFMPESMYYFLFWVLSWVLLTRGHWRWSVRAASAALLLGAMSLVKVHALFLLPALCLFLLYEAWNARNGGPWLRRGALAALLAVALLFGVKFGVGYLFGGKAGLTLFGSFYGAGATAASQRPLLQFLGPALVNLSGHLMTLALLLALPLAMLLQALATRLPWRAPREGRLHLYALLMLGAALGMTVLYTASIARPDNAEALRLHVRYYSFVFPLLFMVAAMPPAAPQPGKRVRIALALLGCGLLALAVVRLPTFVAIITDGPEAAGLVGDRQLLKLLAAAQALALLLWASGGAIGTRLFLFLALPGALLVAIGAERDYLRQLVPSPGFAADEAGRLARRTVPDGERQLVTIAGTGADLFRAQFQLDHKDIGLVELAPGVPIESYNLPVHNKWLLVLGEHRLPDGARQVGAGPGFVLARLQPNGVRVGAAEFGKPFPNGVLAGADGLSYSEGWGRWSDGKRVLLRLASPLPRHAKVVLNASAFGPNTELPFTARAGAQSTTFKVGPMTQDIVLYFETDGQQRELEIEVPQPVAPKDIMQSIDVRTLGISLCRIEINATEPQALGAR